MISVRSIVGLSAVPSTNRGVRDWLKRNGVPLTKDGNRFLFRPDDIPIEVRRALELRQIEAAGLPAGDYDDAAHERFADATPAMQAAALRKAEIARFLVAGGASEGRGLTCTLIEQSRAKFGAEGTDKMTLRRILRTVAGVAPVNFAPALLPSHSRMGKPPAEFSAEAWAYFLTTIRDGGPQFPLVQAWRDVRDVARKRGWAWPKYITVWRRWDALGVPSRLDTDAELRAFILRHIRQMTFPKLAEAVAQSFPPERRVSQSAIHRWWQREGKFIGQNRQSPPNPR